MYKKKINDNVQNSKEKIFLVNIGKSIFSYTQVV